MPIQFRCIHCKQMLSISSRRAGSTVNCPACTEPILVPVPANMAPPTGSAAPSEPAGSALAPPQSPPSVPRSSPATRPVEPTSVQPSSVSTQSASAPRTSSTTPLPKSSAASKPSTTPAKSPAKNLWADEEEDEDAPRGVRESRLSNDGLDMTPMVDVTFQLLIFFMITASFVTQKSLQTTPPEPNEDTGTVTVQLEEMQDQSVIVNIDEQGNMLVDDVPIESSMLVETLMAKMAAEQKTELLIEADYNARHGAIIQVIDAGISAGMQNIRKTSRQDE